MSWREQLAFAPLQMADRSAEVARRLRQAIALGVLEDGTQLPSEGELSSRMGVSLVTLRAGLAQLRSAGLLETRRGYRGGSFVKADLEPFAEVQRATLAGYALEDLRDIREYRIALAGSAAAAAAEKRQLLSLQRLSALGSAVGTATHPVDIARADSRFHMELAALSRSASLTRAEMAMQSEVGVLFWAQVHPADAPLRAAEEHAAIVSAISDSDVQRARALAEQHVRSEMNVLLDLRMSSGRRGARVADDQAATDRAAASVSELAQRFADVVTAAVSGVEAAVLDSLSAFSEDEPRDAAASQAVLNAARDGLVAAQPDVSTLGFITTASSASEAEVIGVGLDSNGSLEEVTMDWRDYDFATAQWWPKNVTQGALHASAAFVDASGSNEFIVAFSKGIWVGSRMIGAVSADILVRRLQEYFQPVLFELPPRSCIIDQNGVVIATNTGSLLGATPSDITHEGTQTPLPGLPWLLHVSTESDASASAQ